MRERYQLALGVSNGRVDGKFRWIRVRAADGTVSRRPAPLHAARALVFALPVALLLWAAIFLAIFR